MTSHGVAVTLPPPTAPYIPSEALGKLDVESLPLGVINE